LNPQEVLDMLTVINAEFRRFRMQDAHEALRMLLGGLQDALHTPEVSPIDEIFSITLNHTRTCAACGAERVNAEHMHELNLPIPSIEGRPITMTDCLEAFLATERIAGVACEGGSCAPEARNDATMTHRFGRLPPVLLISLNRFTWDGQKINTAVEIPPELDMSILPGGGEGRYRLVGIVNHLGNSVGAGHYTAHFMHPEEGSFYNANDGVVSAIDGHPALSNSAAYIVMYERV
jgi:uncharacterized UBP type Zn finger protein